MFVGGTNPVLINSRAASQAGIARVSSHVNAITDVVIVDRKRQSTMNTIAQCNAEANEAVLLKAKTPPSKE